MSKKVKKNKIRVIVCLKKSQYVEKSKKKSLVCRKKSKKKELKVIVVSKKSQYVKKVWSMSEWKSKKKKSIVCRK